MTHSMWIGAAITAVVFVYLLVRGPRVIDPAIEPVGDGGVAERDRGDDLAINTLD